MRLTAPPSLFFNGTVVAWHDARIHVWSETAVRATNVFEGLRAYWSKEAGGWIVVAWAEHMARLQRSAKLIRIPHPFDCHYFATAVEMLLNALPHRQHMYVRPTIFVEHGPFTGKAEEVQAGAYVVAFPQEELPSEPETLRCLVSSWRRLDDLSGSPRAKSGAAYHNIRLPRIEASLRGFDDAIMLNTEGKVSELTGACIFIVRDGRIITPPVTDAILEGITRGWTIREGLRLGFAMEQRSVDRTELYIADEVFSAGTLSEICAIVEIDEILIGSGNVGRFTRSLASSYRKRTQMVEPGDLLVRATQTLD